ncbi:hypothetical protein ACFRFL_45545 [Streptomyces sp. NPDC056708]|uniref:hypothetical protein n=1 Tax=unclassified Streptomyces TaxID=2593676 RepID=UPI0036A6EB39
MNAGYTLKGSKWVWHQTPKKDPESQFLYAAYRQNTSGYLINDYYAQQRANKAAEYRAQAKLAEQRRKAEQQRKQNDIWGSIKSGLGKAWDSTGGKVVSGVADAAGAIGGFFEDHWRVLAQAGIIIVGTIAIGVCTAATAGVCAGAGGIIMSAAIGAAQGIATYGVSGGKHTTSGICDASGHRSRQWRVGYWCWQGRHAHGGQDRQRPVSHGVNYDVLGYSQRRGLLEGW